jgi:SAM-dependent methyltransferase
MRYKVKGFGVIRSENAAKSSLQKSAFASDMISALERVETTVDYGCGKLRYLDEIATKTDRLILVDSIIQFERQQVIFGELTCISEIAHSSNWLGTMTTREFSASHGMFDRAFLMNVLQIIPIPQIRSEVLRRIFRALKPGGELITCVQYRNSDFTRMSKMKNSFRFRDGMIIEHLRGTSFYGFIRPDAFRCMVESAGFHVENLSLHDGSCYIKASRRHLLHIGSLANPEA